MSCKHRVIEAVCAIIIVAHTQTIYAQSPPPETVAVDSSASMAKLTELIKTKLVGNPNVEGACVAVSPSGKLRIEMYVLPRNSGYRIQGLAGDSQKTIVMERPIVPLGARMGTSTSAKNSCGVGTLGIMVHDRTNTTLHGFITCNHVATISNGCADGDNTSAVAPGTLDQKHCIAGTGTEIGTWVRSSDLRTSGLPTYKVDAAFIASRPGAVDARNDCRLCAVSATPAPPISALGNPVLKCGRRTGLTCATVTAVGCVINVDYCECDVRQFIDQIRVEGPFSKTADSGAVVYTTTGEVLGLLFSGDGGNLAFVNPMQTVLDELNVDLDDGNPTCKEPKCHLQSPAPDAQQGTFCPTNPASEE